MLSKIMKNGNEHKPLLTDGARVHLVLVEANALLQDVLPLHHLRLCCPRRAIYRCRYNAVHSLVCLPHSGKMFHKGFCSIQEFAISILFVPQFQIVSQQGTLAFVIAMH